MSRHLSPSGEIKAVTQAILEEIDKRSELMSNIEYLCDMIGPRLTGSANLTQGQSSGRRDKFKQYGLTNPHLEPWTIERVDAWRCQGGGWSCRSSSGSFSSQPAGAPRPRAQSAGAVVHVKGPQSADELASPYRRGKLKGAWVLLSEVSVQPSPKQPAPNMDGEMRRRMSEYNRMREFRPALQRFSD